jgi:hypothetical protein
MNEHLEHLKEIRTMMERSSKFLSLSGLSGISAGICALIGSFFVYIDLDISEIDQLYKADLRHEVIADLIQIAAAVLISSLIFGIFFTVRKAKKQGLKVWNNTSKQLLSSLLVPLLAGGLCCLGFLYHGLYMLCFPLTLIFYGMALVSASKYTVRDTFYLGVSEIVLGIISLFLAKYNLIFWAVGFGVLHIIYGTVMYFKYDIKSEIRN